MEFLKDVWNKIRNVVLNPSDFFEEIEEEKNNRYPLIYLIIIEIVPAIFSYFILMLNISPISMGLRSYEAVSGIFVIFLVFFNYFVGIIENIISAVVIHIFCVLLDGSGDFNASFKSIIYGATPSILAGWIPIVGIIAFLDSIYLQVKGISELHDVSMLRALGILLIPGVILFGIVVFGVLFYYGIFSTNTAVVPTSQLPVGNFLNLVP
ncbi:MAG: YIP1 family protein [Candidatus Aenigmatarchaeota archaeon]